MSLHLDDDEETSPRQTELTLSTGVVLGGIVGLVLLCAIFFGLGYSMHHPSPVALPSVAAEPTTPSTDFSSFKPAAGSPLHPETAPAPSPASSPTLTPRPSPSTPATTVPVSPRPVAAPSQPAAVPVSAAAPPAGNGFYVQVAAVSHQPDADKLAATLHAQGYLVTARQSPQDTLFHVQIGPYSTHKDADLIRQKLAVEGYTPIVK